MKWRPASLAGIALAAVLTVVLANVAIGQNFEGGRRALPSAPTKDCPECPEMVRIPPGTFVMGASIEEEEREKVRPQFRGRTQPQHQVSVGAFSLGRFHVTRAQFAAFIAATAWSSSGCR